MTAARRPRRALAAAALMGVVLVLGACANQQPGAAATLGDSRISEQQLAALKDVTGVCSISMIESDYGNSVGIRSGQLHYGAGIRCARAFSFEELAPRIVLVVADALGISLDDLDVRVSNGLVSATKKNTQVVEAARKLRK